MCSSWPTVCRRGPVGSKPRKKNKFLKCLQNVTLRLFGDHIRNRNVEPIATVPSFGPSDQKKCHFLTKTSQNGPFWGAVTFRTAPTSHIAMGRC